MNKSVTCKSTRTVYADPYMEVEDWLYEHGGSEYRYLVKAEPEFSVVGAVTETGQIVMVRQFRPGPGKFLVDVPGGMIDPGQTPLQAAEAELVEETGFKGEMRAVSTAYVTAYSTARKHIFFASNCRQVAEPEQEETIISEPVLLSKKDFASLIASGEMLDLDCALLLARELGIEWPL